MLFPIIYEYLDWIFFFPLAVWGGIGFLLNMNWALTTTWIIAFLCYAIFMAIFWIICFAIIKLGVYIYDQLKAEKSKKQKNE
jgi:TRAP-type C4-dicarboxylate transport system permease small subunit